jgi:hypothetical protein
MHQPKISFLVTGACGAASPVVDLGGGAAFIDVSEVIFLSDAEQQIDH